MRYCFDLDDTISIHKNRDYPNSVPVVPVIEKIREIKAMDKSAYIIIHTARGMNSCKGDVALAEQRNRSVIEEWLLRYNVPYDEIMFGKPLADVYVDDKAISAHQFAQESVRACKGFSGAEVYKIADMVVKEGERTRQEYEWYESNKRANFTSHKIPTIYSYTLGKIYLEYIEGRLLSDFVRDEPVSASEKYMALVVGVLKEFASYKLEGKNDVRKYSEHIKMRGEAIGIDVSPLCSKIESAEDLEEATFNHGDFTMLNMIVSNTGKLFLIDPTESSISSWLLDAAKFRASLNGLDAAITGKGYDTKYLLPMFDERFCEHIQTIRLLEKTHYIRVMYYAKKHGDKRAFDALEKLLRI